MKLQSIQVLRGIAALLVVFYHAFYAQWAAITAAGHETTPLLKGLYANGYAGVDLFFVISGFIMVWVTRDQKQGAAGSADFLFARLTRIYPLWWAAAFVATLYYLLLHTPEMTDPGWRHAMKEGGAGEYLLKSFLLIPQQDFPVLSIGWTLIHELYFYAVFAGLILLPRRLLPVALLVWGGLVMAASLAGWSHHEAHSLLTLAVHPLTMEFLFGAAVGLILSAGYVVRPGLLTLVGALSLLAALCLSSAEVTPQMLQWGRVASFGLPCALLVYGVAALEMKNRLVWLVPVSVAVLTGGAVYQILGGSPWDAFADRLMMTSIALICAAVAAVGTVLALQVTGQMTDAKSQKRPGGVRILKTGVHFGDWSYSIYLGHLFVIMGVQFVFSHIAQTPALARWFDITRPGSADDIIYIILISCGTILAGWIGYRLVERPGMKLFRNLRRRWFS